MRDMKLTETPKGPLQLSNTSEHNARSSGTHHVDVQLRSEVARELRLEANERKMHLSKLIELILTERAIEDAEG
jgi:hypothetical protein